MRWRTPSRPTLICLGLCALILVIAAVDLAHTESRLPDSAPDCPQVVASCIDARLSAGEARDRAADPLQRRYNSRAWVYASAILAIAAVATAYRLRSLPRTEWPRIFTNLGVIGVWLGIGVVVVLIATDGDAVTVPAAPLLMLPVVAIVAATGGTLVGRSEGWAEQSVDGIRDRVIHLGKLAIHIGTAGQMRRSRLDELARWLSGAALALTTLTCVLALTFVLVQPGCATTGGPPSWTDAIDSAAAVAAVAGVAAGVGALILRRWVPALISLAACPVALLLVLVSSCAFS